MAQAEKTAKMPEATSVQIAAADGDATTANLDQLKPQNFDLVATGKRVHEPLWQFFLGSVSRKFPCTHYAQWSQ